MFTNADFWKVVLHNVYILLWWSENQNNTLSAQFLNQISKSLKEAKSVTLTHKYMTLHCPDVMQVLQWKEEHLDLMYYWKWSSNSQVFLIVSNNTYIRLHFSYCLCVKDINVNYRYKSTDRKFTVKQCLILT